MNTKTIFIGAALIISLIVILGLSNGKIKVKRIPTEGPSPEVIIK